MRKHRWLLLIVVVAAALRVGWALRQPAMLHYPDAMGYDMIARNFLADGRLIQGEPTKVSRVPVYPLYLSACYRLAGLVGLADHDYAVARVVQALAGALLCVVVFFFARELFGVRVAKLAALGAGVYPFFVFYAGLLLTETFFVLALVVFLWLILRIERTPAESLLTSAALGGLLAGLTVLLKPSFLLFIPFVSLLWLLVSSRPGRTVAALAVIALCTAVVMTPWVVRNWTCTGHFVPTTLTVGKSLYEGVYPQADGGPAMDRMPSRVHGVDEYEQNRQYREIAVEIIRKEPGRILALAGRKFLRFWNLIPNSPDHQHVLYRVVSVFSLVPVLCFALVGVVKAPIPRGQRLLLLAPAVYFTLLHMIFVGSIRYRVPVMPFLIMLASIGFFALLGVRPRRGGPPAARPEGTGREGASG